MEQKVVLKTLGWNLAREREQKGLTQVELAAQVQVPQSTLAYSEAGNRNPSVYLIHILSKFLWRFDG